MSSPPCTDVHPFRVIKHTTLDTFSNFVYISLFFFSARKQVWANYESIILSVFLIVSLNSSDESRMTIESRSQLHC